MLREARGAADGLLARAERDALDLQREVARQRTRAPGRPRGTETIDRVVARAKEARSDVAPPGEAPEAEEEEATQPRVGLYGRSRTLGSVGKIVEASGRTGRITLETDGARVVVPGDDVEVVASPAAAPPTADRAADELRLRAAREIPSRLDLRGERVEAALEKLSAFLDQALLAGLDEAVVYHGSGTGALRRAVRERLAEHPHVRTVRPGRKEEGGDGASVDQF